MSIKVAAGCSKQICYKLKEVQDACNLQLISSVWPCLLVHEHEFQYLPQIQLQKQRFDQSSNLGFHLVICFPRSLGHGKLGGVDCQVFLKLCAVWTVWRVYMRFRHCIKVCKIYWPALALVDIFTKFIGILCWHKTLNLGQRLCKIYVLA
jgi:hypothetical protein